LPGINYFLEKNIKSKQNYNILFCSGCAPPVPIVVSQPCGLLFVDTRRDIVAVAEHGS